MRHDADATDAVRLSTLSAAIRWPWRGARRRGAPSPDAPFAAFISYATDPDARLAQRLHDALESFDGGLMEGRSRRVFHDFAVLGAHPDLGRKLAESIRRSEHLVLLAGPPSRDSPWVLRELRCFLGAAASLEAPLERESVAEERLARLIIVQTGGALRWTPPGDDPRDALAPELAQVLRSEPLVVDFRGWQRWDANTWRMKVARVLAAIRGVDVDAIWGEHLRRERRKRLLVTSASAALAAMAIGVAVSAIGWAASTRRLAAGGLLATARESIAADPVHALLLADRAIGMLEHPIPADELRAAPLLASLPPVKRYLSCVPRQTQQIAISPDGSKVAAAGPQGLAVWDVDSGALRCNAKHPMAAGTHLEVHPDGTLDAAGPAGWERRGADCGPLDSRPWTETPETIAANERIRVAAGRGRLQWRDEAGWHAAALPAAWAGWPAADPEGRWHLDAAALHPVRPEVALGTRSGAVGVCVLGPGDRLHCTPLGDPQLGSIEALAYSPGGTRLLAAGPSGVALREGRGGWKALTESSTRALAATDDAAWSIRWAGSGSELARQSAGAPPQVVLAGLGRGLLDETVIGRNGFAAALYDRFSGTPAIAVLDPQNPPLVQQAPVPGAQAMSADARNGVFVTGTGDGRVLRTAAPSGFVRVQAFTPPPDVQNCLIEAPLLSPDATELALLACKVPMLVRLSDGTATPIALPADEPERGWLPPVAWIGTQRIVFHSSRHAAYLLLDRQTGQWRPLGGSAGQRILPAPDGAWILKAGSIERLDERGVRPHAIGATSGFEDQPGGDERQRDLVTPDGRYLVAVRVTGEVRIHAIDAGRIAAAKTLRVDRSYEATTGPADTLFVATTRGIHVIRLDSAEILTTLPLDPDGACPSAYHSPDRVGRQQADCQVQRLAWEGGRLRVVFADRVVTWNLEPDALRRKVCELAGPATLADPPAAGILSGLWWWKDACGTRG